MKTILRFFAFATAVLAVDAASHPSPVQAQETNGNWTEFNGDYRAWRYSPLDKINASNVGKLKVAWIHQAGDITMGLQVTPLAIDGILYYIAPGNRVFAIDGATGNQIWEYLTQLDPEHAKSLYAFNNRGVAATDDRILFGTLDGRMIALERKTGKEVWKTQLVVPKECHGCNFNSPPTVAGDVAIIGGTGGDIAQKGRIFGVNIADGKVLWTFEVLKDDPASWKSEARKTGGGGAWIPGQFDPKTGLYYVGTSNPAPDYRGSVRPGDNLYTCSIIALDPKTGVVVWHHQEVPHDVWDYDSQNEIVSVQHEGRELIFHLNKGGFVTVLDKKDGSVVNVWQFNENITWVDKIDPKTGALGTRNEPSDTEMKLMCPTGFGGRVGIGGSYSPKTELWYSNGYELCATIRTGEQPVEKLAYSQIYLGMAEFEWKAPTGKGLEAYLKAVDPMTGKVAWRVPMKLPGMSSVLSTAGDLVFNGDSEGFVHAYAAADGKELWKFQTGSGIRAGIISYMAGGKQYIVVPAGMGGGFPLWTAGIYPEFKTMRGGATVIAFTLE